MSAEVSAQPPAALCQGVVRLMRDIGALALLLLWLRHTGRWKRSFGIVSPFPRPITSPPPVFLSIAKAVVWGVR